MAVRSSNGRIEDTIVYAGLHSNSRRLHSLITEILDRHHAYLKAELPAIEALLKEVFAHDTEPFRTTASNLLPTFVRFRTEIVAHMKREEVTLFPLIDRLEMAVAEGRPVPRNPFGPLSNPIQFMNEDHDFEDRLLKTMADITGQFTAAPQASVRYASLMKRLHTLKLDVDHHVRKEDEMLFPAAICLEESGRLRE